MSLKGKQLVSLSDQTLSSNLQPSMTISSLSHTIPTPSPLTPTLLLSFFSARLPDFKSTPLLSVPLSPEGGGLCLSSGGVSISRRACQPGLLSHRWIRKGLSSPVFIKKAEEMNGREAAKGIRAKSLIIKVDGFQLFCPSSSVMSQTVCLLFRPDRLLSLKK